MRNRHNRPMKNQPGVAPKDHPAGPKDHPVGPKDHPVGLAGPLGAPADLLVGPEDHPAKKEKRRSPTTRTRTIRATGVTIIPQPKS